MQPKIIIARMHNDWLDSKLNRVDRYIPRKLIIVAIISALDVMIATPKNKISAACVKASRFDVYSCWILSLCRCIFAPNYQSTNNRMNEKKIIINWKLNYSHRFTIVRVTIKTLINWNENKTCVKCVSFC